MITRTRPWIVIIFAILIACRFLYANAATLEPDRASAFLDGLLTHPDSMDAFLDEDDLGIVRRLDISYPEAPSKALISWDLSAPQRERLKREGLDGQFIIEKLDNRHSRLKLFPADSTATRSWIFRDGKVVSSILYQLRTWKQIDSPHFRFFISDTTLFHPANIEALEFFLEETTRFLGMSAADMEQLAREKIYYCFCSNQDEMRELTGFAARGMYVVSHDLIVSTYSSHLHELAHLLINFKLKRPHLYTHPLFLEGFAVAVGGRGGKKPDILHQLGVSILRQGWVSVDEMVDVENFYRVNSSMSYPGSAVYNRFLMEELSLEDYLALYADYGGDARSMTSLEIDPAELPDEAAWRRYLDGQPQEGAIKPAVPGLDATAGPVSFHPCPDGSHFGFALADTLLACGGLPAEGYHSFLYEEFFPGGSYGGQRYLIRVSAAEAAIYDLFTNTMIGLYASGFSEDMEELPSSGGLFRFRVDRSVFRSPPTKE